MKRQSKKAAVTTIMPLFILTITVLLILCASCTPTKKEGAETGEKQLRIASMAPSSTSILSGLGIAGSIVAIDTWSAEIPGLVAGTPQFDMMSPDIERLAALNCDLLLVSTMTQAGTGKDPFKPLSDSGVRVEYIPTSNSIDEIRADVTRIALLTGRVSEGKALILKMDTEIGAVKSVADKIPENKRRSAVFEIASAPSIYSFGSGVYLNELMETAGVKNILRDEKGWIAVSAEVIVASDPDVILTNVSYLPDPVAEIKTRAGWEGMKAVKENRVYYIDNASSSQPSPDVVKALKEIAEAVYPEYFK